ncbi:MAG: histidine kinase dimerization/phosphoacceptor domain -containing protein [Cyanobacteriota bacterium]
MEKLIISFLHNEKTYSEIKEYSFLNELEYLITKDQSKINEKNCIIITDDFSESNINKINKIKNTPIVFIIDDYESCVSDEFNFKNISYILKDDKNKYLKFLFFKIEMSFKNELLQKEIAETNKKYRSLIENNPIGVLLADTNGNILEVNERIIKILGSPSKEATKKINLLTFKNLITSGFPDDFINCMKEKSLIIRDVPYHTNWNKDIVMRYHVSPLTSEENTIFGVYCLIEDITEKKKDEEKIIQSLREKETLLKEVHHRVKNNLQIISSLINLQAHKIKNEAVLDIFRESQNRIRAMALIHEELYNTERLILVNFRSYITNLTNFLYKSYKIDSLFVKFDIKVEDIFIDIETAIPVALIINESVSNSLKYAFPKKNLEKNKISIDFTSQNNNFTLIIKDNGIGLPKDIEDRKNNSLGIKLIESLSEQIDGDLNLNSYSEGTSYKIVFPMHQK